MLVLRETRGKWGRSVIFSDRTWMLFRGRIALAKSGGGTQTQDTVPTGPWQPQIPLINMLFGEAANLYRGGPPQFFPGQTVLPAPGLVNDTRNATINQVNANAPQNQGVSETAAGAATGAYQNPVATAAGQVTPQLSGAIGNLLSGLPPGTGQGIGAQISAPQQQSGNINLNPTLERNLSGNIQSPFLDSVIEGALRNSNLNFQRNIIPSIGDEASAAGQVGGSRQGVAQGVAAGDLARSQDDMISQIMQSAYDQGIQTQQNAIGTISGAQAGNVDAILRSLGLDQQGRALTQQGQIAGGQLASGLLTGGQQLGTQQLATAGSLLPALQGANLSQLGFANELGVQQYGFDQAQRDAEVERWFFEQFAPYNALTQFQNFVSGPYGSSIAGRPNTPVNQFVGVQPGGRMQIPTPIGPGQGQDFGGGLSGMIGRILDQLNRQEQVPVPG